MKKILFLIILSTFFIFGCQTNIENENIEIITTIYPLSEFAKEVGGDNVKVTMLLPPGAEAHTYDPTPSDIIRSNRADMFIYIGEEMEPWAKKIINSISEDIKIIESIKYVNEIIEGHEKHDDELIEKIDPIIHEWEDNEITSEESMQKIEELIHDYLNDEKHDDDYDDHDDEHTKENYDDDHSHDNELIEKIDHIIHEFEDNEITAEEAMQKIEELVHDYLNDDDHDDEHAKEDDENHSHEYDPHIWLNFENNIDIVNTIAKELSILDPENEQYYKNNANNYNNKLKALDQLYEESLDNCNNRIIISAGHNIFGYLEEEYDFKSITAHGVSPDSEPTPATIKEIIDLLNENNINYVIFEEMVNSRLANTLASDTNAQTLVFNPSANVLKDNEGKTFIAIMQSNLETLTKAMDCN